MSDLRPVALARRERAWRQLASGHRAGAHHALLCATPSACAAYDRVLRAQLDLVDRALRLPPEFRAGVADALDARGRAPLRRLVETAERSATLALGPVVGG